MARQRDNAYLVPPNFAFIKHPYMRGFWVRADKCVVLIACPFCSAKIGELCVTTGKTPLLWTHHQRRTAAKELHCVRQDGICIDLNLVKDSK